ncbi:BZ3500_MvSof-1268-A1-R1_Chr8-2g10083 [Microbotryum saponariae]|uniref:BZ3500_MvSof-1268-A1-R1_Chr8-2g10083 protein n=1 Tax=Microbotryum saponariae TaxID=289078 RepID=A0A2X0L7V1_9BASI|nr:BZ3500_MvSof-1268-A1-R1_Chr8-2g10083 [Microbotryum saponariae]SDA01749.1 BZ3501_MvSof-1269-A2-R1_Chr8-2g09834 [Microbotryum saponariae]
MIRYASSSSRLLFKEVGDDFEPRPIQINAIAGLLELDRKRGWSGKSTLFEAINLVFSKRAVTIIVSPLKSLNKHQAAKLCMRGKQAVVVSKKTWEDGTLYEPLKGPLCKVEYIFIVSFKTFLYDAAIKIAEWGLTGRKDRVGAMAHTTEDSNPFRAEYAQIVQKHFGIGCQAFFLTAGAPPDKIVEIPAVAKVSKSRALFAKANLFRPNLRNIVVKLRPQTKVVMTDVLKICNSREGTLIGLSAVKVDSPLARKFTAVRSEYKRNEDIDDFESILQTSCKRLLAPYAKVKKTFTMLQGVALTIARVHE